MHEIRLKGERGRTRVCTHTARYVKIKIKKDKICVDFSRYRHQYHQQHQEKKTDTITKHNRREKQKGIAPSPSS